MKRKESTSDRRVGIVTIIQDEEIRKAFGTNVCKTVHAQSGKQYIDRIRKEKDLTRHLQQLPLASKTPARAQRRSRARSRQPAQAAAARCRPCSLRPRCTGQRPCGTWTRAPCRAP